ncbi:MAG: PAS domain-containing protein [Qipengyuania flava]
MEKLFRREVIEAIGHGVIFSDAEQLITYANGSFCELTGYDRSEIVGRNCRFLQGARYRPRNAGSHTQGARRRAAVRGRDPQLPQGRQAVLEQPVDHTATEQVRTPDRLCRDHARYH